MSEHYWPIGIVSNCWSTLLAGPSSLEDQCRQAVDQGYQVVELRQRALAECEQEVVDDERPWPLPDRLARLHAHLPALQFHLAVEAPFMSAGLPSRDAYLDRCIEAAQALGDAAFLRLVDPTPTGPGIDHPETIDDLGRALGDFGAHCWGSSVRLVVENARQSLAMLRRVIHRASFVMPSAAPPIGVCWDPVNMIGVAGSEEDPVEAARTFVSAGPEVPDELAEAHYKQVADGTGLPTVREGDVDWAGVLAALRDNEYHGPWLFEIPPGDDIWERLRQSREYVAQVAGSLPDPPSGSEQ